jgi:SAM-dependent methyltransferase
VGFAVAAEAYDRFMGRYSVPLGPAFADLAGVADGQRVLDVGSGPGALTQELVRRLGAGAVVAVDRSASFVAALRERHPGVSVHQASAEELPFEDGSFDAALAQLVVHFMTDPVQGLGEMGRVTRSGGVVAACVWDHASGTGPLGLFWRAVHELDPTAEDESGMAGARKGHLAELLDQAGLGDIQDTSLTVEVGHPTFEDWWEPFTLGVGPAGAYVAGLDDTERGRLEERCRSMHPSPPFTMTAVAWAARGTVA